MNKSPYGKTIVLKEDAHNVECWNFADNSKHILPKGTRLLIEHVNEPDSTTCMLVDENGKHPGIELLNRNGAKQIGYRFILKNAELNRLADAGLPLEAFDVVGAIMAYEQGDLDEKSTIKLFQHLKAEGMIDKLQGHYGREARRMGIM